MQGRKRVVVLTSGDPISTEPFIIGDSLTLSTGQGTRINYDIKYRTGREG